jgi:hypothetical protein
LGEILERIDKLINESVEQQARQDVYDNYKGKDLDEEKLKIEVSKTLDSYSYKRITKEISITSEDGTILKDETIKNLLKDISLNNLKPKKLNVVFQRGYNNRFTINITKTYHGELEYEIDCFDSNINDDIKYELDKWIDKLRPLKILQIWSNYGDFLAFISFFPLIAFFLLTILKFESSYSETLNKEASKILNEGIDSTNIDLAVELLLKYSSNYRPKDFVPTEKQGDPEYFRLFILSLYVFLIGIIRPRTTFGVAKRKFLYRFYKFWIKFVMITVPTALIIAPLWKEITIWIY